MWYALLLSKVKIDAAQWLEAACRCLTKRACSWLGEVCEGFGKLLADAGLQVHILVSKLDANGCHSIGSSCTHRPVVLMWTLAHALRDHASHEWRDQLVQVQLELDVRVPEQA